MWGVEPKALYSRPSQSSAPIALLWPQQSKGHQGGVRRTRDRRSCAGRPEASLPEAAGRARQVFQAACTLFLLAPLTPSAYETKTGRNKQWVYTARPVRPSLKRPKLGLLGVDPAKQRKQKVTLMGWPKAKNQKY